MRHPLFAVLLALSAILATPLRAAESAFATLAAGVAEIDAPGTPGQLAVFGTDAFVVVAGKDGKTLAPVVAAAQAGKGRIVVFGHTGYLEAGILGKADTGKFLDNAIAWAGGSARPAIVVPKSRPLADALAKRGFPVATAALAQLQPGQVLLLSAHAITDADVPVLRKFLESGGGLITCATGWGWAQGGKNLANEFAANQLLAPFGLVVSGGTVSKTSANGFAVTPQLPPYLHAGKALAAARSGAKLSKDEIAQASASLTDAAQSLPSGDTHFLPQLHALRTQPGINTTPTAKTPVKAEQLAARVLVALEGRELSRQTPAGMKAHPSAAAFPGAVPADSARESVSVTIDPRVPNWHSTGCYAAPGEVVTVRVPAALASAGWRVRIGAHTDRLWHLDSWKRFPEISRSFPLTAAETTAANPFGGLIYLEVPKAGAADASPVKVEIAGAVRAPHYIHGRTSATEWQQLRNAPAPWGELETKKIILTLPTSVLRDLADPVALMKTWDEALDHVADLATIPRDRTRPERVVPDQQISAGYMHSGYPIMTWMDVPRAFATDAHMRKGDWGIFHELGHNHQVGDWTFEGTTEVTCNLFTMYVFDKLCGVKPAQGRVGLPVVAEKFAKYTAGGKPDFDKWKSDPFLALAMYVQLQHAFGWEPFQKIFAEYRALPAGERPKSNSDRMDQWLTRFSKTVNRNLGPFFQAWGFPVTAPAVASITNLPAWPKEEWPGTNGKF